MYQPFRLVIISYESRVSKYATGSCLQPMFHLVETRSMLCDTQLGRQSVMFRVTSTPAEYVMVTNVTCLSNAQPYQTE